jgi:hypothetical protein
MCREIETMQASQMEQHHATTKLESVDGFALCRAQRGAPAAEHERRAHVSPETATHVRPGGGRGGRGIRAVLLSVREGEKRRRQLPLRRPGSYRRGSARNRRHGSDYRQDSHLTLSARAVTARTGTRMPMSGRSFISP